jgi:hypothetical protein
MRADLVKNTYWCTCALRDHSFGELGTTAGGGGGGGGNYIKLILLCEGRVL